MKDSLAMIKSQIPSGKKLILEAFGKIVFRAWKTVEPDSKEEIENTFLQVLLEGTIHASSGKFAASIRRVLGVFIMERTRNGVDKLLFRFAEPVVFRSLQNRYHIKRGFLATGVGYLDGHTNTVISVSCHPTLNMIASAGLDRDRTVHVWIQD